MGTFVITILLTLAFFALLTYAIYLFKRKSIRVNSLIQKAAEAKEKGENHYLEALGYLDQILEISPNSEAAAGAKGVIYHEMKNYPEALRWLNKAIEINPNNAQWYYNKAILLGVEGGVDEVDYAKFEESVALFEKVISLSPDYFDAWHLKARMLTDALNKDEEAVACYTAILQRFNFNEGAEVLWQEKGDILMKMQRYSEAFECYDKAIELYPDNAQVYAKKGWAMGAAGEEYYDEAIKYYKKALEFDPNDINIWNILSMLYSEMEDYTEAEQYFNKIMATTEGQNNAEMWCNGGVLYMRMKNYDEAMHHYKRSLELDAEHGLAWYNMGQLYSTTKNYTEAKRCYEKALERMPNDMQTWYDLAITYTDMGKDYYTDALDCFNKVLAISPDNKVVKEAKKELMDKMITG